jgi:hypothetical protein
MDLPLRETKNQKLETGLAARQDTQPLKWLGVVVWGRLAFLLVVIQPRVYLVL